MSSQLLLISQSMDGSQVGNSYIWQIWKKNTTQEKIQDFFYILCNRKILQFCFPGNLPSDSSQVPEIPMG